jgi:hypothetical protein
MGVVYSYSYGGDTLLLDQYRPFAILKPKNRKKPNHCTTTTSAPTTKTRSSTRTTTALTTPISVVGSLCFNAYFSQLLVEPKPPLGGHTKNPNYLELGTDTKEIAMGR